MIGARGALLVLYGLASPTLVAACDRGGSADRGAASAGQDAPSSSGADDLAASRADSVDRWSKEEVIKRLAEAGLVVFDSGSAPPFPPLARSGDRLRVSGSELRLYLYPTSAARETVSAALDTTPPKTGYAVDWRSRPRIILVNNLIALHFTPNGRLAERVDNVLRARHLGQ